MRTHLSDSKEPIILRNVEMSPESLPYKPTGLWYEVDGDWRRWCKSEDFCLDKYRYIHQIDLKNCNIKKIDTLQKLDQFHDCYRIKYKNAIEGIDWEKVARKFDGIEIAPYQWKRRLHPGFTWYYGWDCASGCIWRPTTVEISYLEEWKDKVSKEFEIEEVK